MSLTDSLTALKRYTCRRVLEQLRGGPKTVAEIAAPFQYSSRPNVSQALALLLKAGLVSRHRQGRQHYYRLRPKAFEELVSYLQKLAEDARS